MDKTETDRSEPQRRRLDTVTARLEKAFVDPSGQPPRREEVAAVVEEESQKYADAPVQDFVTLLTEHDSREALRERGLDARSDGPDIGDVDPHAGEGDRPARTEDDDQAAVPDAAAEPQASGPAAPAGS